MIRAVSASIVLLVSSMAQAEPCKITNYRAVSASSSYALIEGETTCASGEVILRIYGPDKKWFGNSKAKIKGHTFTATVLGSPPKQLSIEYVIEPD